MRKNAISSVSVKFTKKLNKDDLAQTASFF